MRRSGQRTGWIDPLGVFVSRVLNASWSTKKLISTLLGRFGSTMVLCRVMFDEQRTSRSRHLFRCCVTDDDYRMRDQLGRSGRYVQSCCGSAYERHGNLLVAASLSSAGSTMYPQSPLFLPILHDQCSTSFFGRGGRSDTALQRATGASLSLSCRCWHMSILVAAWWTLGGHTSVEAAAVDC